MNAISRLLLLAAVALALPAEAGLGQSAGVPPSSANLQAKAKATAEGAGYTHVQRALDSGGVVHEFVDDASGIVFAVAWSGPFLPDLRSLLGPSFESLAGAGASRGRTSALSITRPDLVLASGGRMGAFQGHAWLPAHLPAGFDTGLIP